MKETGQLQDNAGCDSVGNTCGLCSSPRWLLMQKQGPGLLDCLISREPRNPDLYVMKSTCQPKHVCLWATSLQPLALKDRSSATGVSLFFPQAKLVSASGPFLSLKCSFYVWLLLIFSSNFLRKAIPDHPIWMNLLLLFTRDSLFSSFITLVTKVCIFAFTYEKLVSFARIAAKRRQEQYLLYFPSYVQNLAHCLVLGVCVCASDNLT